MRNTLYICPPFLNHHAMPVLTPPTLVVEFRSDQARFQSAAHRDQIAKIVRQADRLIERAEVERDRLKVRARL